jgi:hypothetical protein
LALAALLAAMPALGVAATMPADTLGRPTPRGALCRSLLVPGWGQWANGHRVKAGLSGVSSMLLLGTVAARQRSLERATSAADHQDLAGRRNTGLLLLALSVTLSGLDAYVDAQLRDFATALPGLSAAPASTAFGLTWVWPRSQPMAPLVARSPYTPRSMP